MTHQDSMAEDIVDDQGPIESLLQDLERHGFRHTFKIKNEGIVCEESEQHFEATDLELVAAYRFGGMSDPSDSQVVYALRTTNGTRGVIIDAYGAYADPDVTTIIERAVDLRGTSDLEASLPSSKEIVIQSNV